MERLIFCLMIPLLLAVSCTSKPQVPENAAPAQIVYQEDVVPVIPAIPIVDVPAFDPEHVPKELFNYTKLDVQRFVEKMNGIIRARDYDGWVANLGEDYFKEKNSEEYLARISEMPNLKSRGIVLKTARAYFTYVVVAAGARDRADDIEFISERRVKAFSIRKGQRVRLYDLEFENGAWKIVN
ncbi:hypothetical protein AGMMS49546_37490 [Spirochaetia bacterium]|nr:hypothetical protein AGMMS49546_37490 [Spirochaetia bacterium]